MFSLKTKATWLMCEIKDELYTTYYALIFIYAVRVKSHSMNLFKEIASRLHNVAVSLFQFPPVVHIIVAGVIDDMYLLLQVKEQVFPICLKQSKASRQICIVHGHNVTENRSF